ncbi:hypothetical protein K4F52_010336 [Lecanicillium sp. MT-2017a]|nr:hypothetical protein K4F52_010336 [Lecanicillium sp. MT-2017a]
MVALLGSALAAPSSETRAATCNNGFFYGEAACKDNCPGGKCTIANGQENAKDYICVCSDTSQPGCGGMFRGEAACSKDCQNGDCVQLLLPYDCTCPN